VAMALSKQDAEIIGMWGIQVGDVVVVLETGYTLAKKVGERPWRTTWVMSPRATAGFKPTSETRFGTEKASMPSPGPNSRRATAGRWISWGNLRLIDVTPTSATPGDPAAGQSQGRSPTIC